MTYGVVFHVPAPVQLYDQLHGELLRTTTDPVEGLLVHVGRPTAAGFEVIEVWESKEQCEHYNRELVGPVLARIAGDQPPPPEAGPEEFEVRGLVIPSAGLAS